jgi:tetratricopeptide (TPR) repeat protein
MKKIILVMITLINISFVKASNDVPKMTSSGSISTTEVLPRAGALIGLDPVVKFYKLISDFYTKGLYELEGQPFKDSSQISKSFLMAYWVHKDLLLVLIKNLQKAMMLGESLDSIDQDKAVILGTISRAKDMHQLLSSYQMFGTESWYHEAKDIVNTIIINVCRDTAVEIGWFVELVTMLGSLENDKPLEQITVNPNITNEIKKAAIDLFYLYFVDLPIEEINKITAYYRAMVMSSINTSEGESWLSLVRIDKYEELEAAVKKYTAPALEHFQGASKIALEKMNNLAQEYNKQEPRIYKARAELDIIEHIKELSQWSLAEKNYKKALFIEKESVAKHLTVLGVRDLVIGYLENKFSSDSDMVSVTLEAGKNALKCDSIFKLDTHNNSLTIDWEKIQKQQAPFRFQDFFVAKLQYMSWLCDTPGSSLRAKKMNQKDRVSRLTGKLEPFEIIDTEKGYIWSTALIDCIKKTHYLPSKEFYEYVMNFPVDRIRDQLLKQQAQQVTSFDGKYVVVSQAK